MHKHRFIKFAGKFAPIKMADVKVETGDGALGRMPDILKSCKVTKPLIVTDEVLVSHGLVKLCTDVLDGAGVPYAIYDKVVPNPHTALVFEGKAIYQAEGCDGIIVFGGGSPMDCGKIIAAATVTDKPIAKMAGMNKISKKGQARPPPIIAIPTTAGTASETSPGAVITLEEDHRKVIIADPGILPKVAVLDPKVLVGLPPAITAATGMDALTHAVESFLSVWRQPETRVLSLLAVEKIFKNLAECCENGHNLVAREEMLIASFSAGKAFSRTNLGYVHAIAHQFGGLYGTPHGVANAMVLPYILEAYASRGTTEIIDLYAELCFAAGLASRDKSYSAEEKKALMRTFIQGVKDLSVRVKIPTHVADLKPGDVQTVVARALAEAHGETAGIDAGYPSPAILEAAEVARIVTALLPPGQQASKL